MTATTPLELSEQALRAQLLAELREQQLVVADEQEELLLRMCLSAYREDVMRALPPGSEST